MKYYLPGGKSIILDSSKFFASGGEGELFLDNNILYKIFNSTPPEPGRIVDLSIIANPKVIKPLDPISDGVKTVGYTYNFVKAKSQLDLYILENQKNFNIESRIRELIKENWFNMESCHKHDVICVDYNANNILYSIDKDIKSYLIDVLSFKTSHFPATALMADIEDFLCKRNFSFKSDYYSFHLHSFRLLTGLHPYQGNHPSLGKYSIDKLKERQESKVTVYDSKMIIPSFLRDFRSRLSKSEYDFFYSTFVEGVREKPNFSVSNTGVNTVTNNSPYSVQNGDDFKLVPILQSPVWTITNGNVTTTPALSTIGNSIKSNVQIISQTEFNLEVNKSYVNYVVDSYSVSDKFIVYSLNNNLYRLTLVYAGKSQFVQNMLLTPLSSKYSLYNNVCVQSYQDFTFVTLVGQNTVSSHPFKELKEYNILDAKCIENVVCFIVTKDQIKYDFVYIKQNPLNQAKYTISTYPNCGLGNVNFAIKENGVAIAVLPNDHTVLFSSVWDDLKHNVIQDSCLESDLKVFTRGNDVLLTRGNVVYTLTKK